MTDSIIDQFVDEVQALRETVKVAEFEAKQAREELAALKSMFKVETMIDPIYQTRTHVIRAGWTVDADHARSIGATSGPHLLGLILSKKIDEVRNGRA